MVSPLLISTEMGLQIVREKQFHDEQKNCYFQHDYFPQGFAGPHGSETVKVKVSQAGKAVSDRQGSRLFTCTGFCLWLNQLHLPAVCFLGTMVSCVDNHI
jgi:hypothetical protein